MSDDGFRAVAGAWQPIAHRRLAWARRVMLILIAIPLIGIAITAIVIRPEWRWWILLASGAGFLLGLWAWWLIGRRVRSFAYAEREDDLSVTSGILFRRLVIVPYGRMQLVDMTAGPIDRWFGITSVQLHTAAATTDAKIPGLRPPVAAALRDRLARLGEERSAGL